MLPRKLLVARVVCAMLLASACQDVPTGPERAAPLPALSAGGMRTGQVPFYCSISRLDPAPGSTWRTARFTFYFPRAELDAAGRTVLYQLRRPDASGVEIYRADCTVPYTERALRRVDRAFGVDGEGGAEVFVARQGMVTTQGCVTDGHCTLEPIVVKAPVKPDNDPDDPCTRYPDQCEDAGGGTPDSGGGGEGDGGGDGDGGEPDEYTEPNPEDARPHCEKDAYGYCVTRPITLAEWEQLGKVIESLREDITECREAKRILQGYHARGHEAGRFTFWDGKDLNATGTRQRYGFITGDAGGRIINVDGYHALRDRGVVVHEALHVYLNNINSPLKGPDNENWVSQWESTCER